MPDSMQDRLALDRGSIRTTDERSGHLHVSQTPISKANICPYWGAEIPDNGALGLRADKRYMLLRDPGEMEKAAKSFDGKPLLIKHRAQSADDHDRDVVVGSVNNPVWDAPYLKADLSVWDGDAIKAIESNKQRQLSCGYFYRADMTPGTYQGERYDGRMVDIAGNHTALVDEGRAGPDVMVGDAKLQPLQTKPTNQEITMVKSHASRQALLASGALSVYLRPKLAQDAKVDLAPVLAGVTGKNWATSKPKIKTALDKAVKGKLATDADLSDILDMLDQLEEMPDEDVAAAAVDAKPDDQGENESDEDYAKRKKAEADKDAAKDKGAKDKGAKDADPEPKVSKSAMDAAIAAASDAAARNAEASTIARLNAIRAAEREVQPYVGNLAVAMDSAAAVYHFALESMGVDAKAVTDVNALRLVLNAQPKPGEQRAPATVSVAMDAAAAKAHAARFPNANRLVRS